jgi:hypothetical protein
MHVAAGLGTRILLRGHQGATWQRGPRNLISSPGHVVPEVLVGLGPGFFPTGIRMITGEKLPNSRNSYYGEG